MGVISHKGAYCAEAGSKLEVIVGQNQCCLPLRGVRISISSTEDGQGTLLPTLLLTVLKGPEEGTLQDITFISLLSMRRQGFQNK